MSAPWPPTMLLPTVSVYSDDVQLADGRDDSDAPQVLTDLVVRWGRTNVVDQPQPSTCALTLQDLSGGSRFTDLVQVGGRLDVIADAVIGIPPDPDDSDALYVIDETYSAGVGNTWVSAGRADLGTVGGWLTVDPADGDRAVTVTVPPAPREPVGGNPAAWDSVPRSLSGETWYVKVDPALPAPFAGWDDWAVQVVPVTFATPWATPVALDPITGTEGAFVPPPNSWLGVSVRYYPTGPAWADLDGTTWDALGDDPTWRDLGRLLVDRVQLIAPEAGTARQGMVFSGRITDLEARYSDADSCTYIDVTAADQRAELGNRDVGDEPWPEETIGSRFGRIVSLSGQPIQSRVSSSAAALLVSWRDVDRQSAMTLLSELATSADGVLWAATHPTTGPYLQLESLSDRLSLFGLVLDPDGLVRIHVLDPEQSGAVEVNSCDVLLEPIRWRHDIEDTATRVVVTWREQTTDDDGNMRPTDRTVTVLNPPLEAVVGVHRIAVGTQLSQQTDADTVANAILGRTGTDQWRVSGLEWRADTTDQLDGEALGRFMTLLDGTTRNGLPVVLTDLPDWSPVVGDNVVALYVEGGTYTSHDGAWQLDLVVSSANTVGDSVAWQDLPAENTWAWDDFDPAIRWADLGGVSYTGGT